MGAMLANIYTMDYDMLMVIHTTLGESFTTTAFAPKGRWGCPDDVVNAPRGNCL